MLLAGHFKLWNEESKCGESAENLAFRGFV
jgi:hypothetical protein